MKFMLAMIFCTAVYQQCQEPHAMPGSYDNWYNCMLAGYKEASIKMREVGKDYANKDGIYIKFFCVEDKRTQT
jgi:hypothetical protein